MSELTRQLEQEGSPTLKDAESKEGTMPLIINTNISTLVEQRKASPLDRSSSGLAKLSSGVRGKVHSELEASPSREVELLRTEVRGLANKQQRATA